MTARIYDPQVAARIAKLYNAWSPAGRKYKVKVVSGGAVVTNGKHVKCL
jgi:hypothetical protein